jgi:hypothetical protein
MTVIWTLPGTFGPQQTNGAELGETAAQQSANFFLPSIAACWLGYSPAVRNFLSASAARLAMDPFEKKRLLPIELMIALAINVVVAILGYYAIMMWGLYKG